MNAEQLAHNPQTELDPERQRLAKEYARIRRRMFFVELGVLAVGLYLLLAMGLSSALRDWAESVSSNPWVIVAL
jgi:STE24 endopeptidase